jgi:hypothetical protein
MNPDDFKQAYQGHPRLAGDAESLLKEVQRNEQSFNAMIFWRDFREIGIALLLLPAWLYLGIMFQPAWSPPWTWYLTVPVLVWMAGFMLVYRMRHKQKPSKPDEPLLHCVERSVTEVEDQIWLLRNIFWWYLLPPGISIMAFFVHLNWTWRDRLVARLLSKDWLDVLDALGHAVPFVVVIGVYYFIYWLNQYAVRTQLEPRRQELLTLLMSFEVEKPDAS